MKKSEVSHYKRSGLHFLLGLVVALSFSLIALEYGKQKLVQRENYNTAEAADYTEQEWAKVVTLPKPLPKKTVLQQAKIVQPIINLEPVVEPVVEPSPMDQTLVLDTLPIPMKPETPIEEPFLIVEVMPEFPGGEQGLLKFLADNTTYPKRAKQNGITGTVWVEFIVEPNGTIDMSKALILRGPDGMNNILGREALRVVSMMPTWRPGIQQGRQVPVRLVQKFNFRLNN